MGSPLLNGKVPSSRPRPDCFGSFQVRAELGASRFAPVYVGHDPSSNTPVVIHTIKLKQEWRKFGAQADLLDAFRQLCDKTLDHPGLARPIAFGAEGNIPYVVYSHLSGAAMDAVIRQDGARPVAEVLQRTKQLAEAIDLAANAGVHHGVIAPCDVILEGERTGITGFGLAQALIKAGIPTKAPAPYGSPQRLAGAPPTRADDIYSLAAIALELLIGTPADPKQNTSPALREAQGLPERRSPRPAAHETRLFTTIAGVDAGKLRAAFAAAFSEEPGERPSTGAEFFASFDRAFSTGLGTNEPASKPVVVPFVRDERENPPFAPVVKQKGAGDVVNEPRERKPEIRLARPEPIVDDEVFAEVTPPPARSIDETTYWTPDRSRSRALVVAGAVAVSFATAGFVGGFIVGQRSMPSTRSADATPRKSSAETQPPHVTVEEPTLIASTTPPIAAASDEQVSKPGPTAATTQKAAPISNEPASSPKPSLAPVAPQVTTPAVDSGRLLIRSTPAGAGVVVDGQSHGVTPLTVRELAFGEHTIEVSHEGQVAQQKRVTLSERRPSRMVDFELGSTSVPAPAAAATNSPGSLQVTSRPPGANVFVDDNLIGKTPLLVEVAPGSRGLRLELSGYKTFTTSVEVKQSARSRVAATLEP